MEETVNDVMAAVTNSTHQWTRALLDSAISYEDDIDSAARVIKDTAVEMSQKPDWQQAFLSKPEVLGVEKLDDSAVVLRLIAQAVPGDQWRLAREMRRRVRYALEAAGMTIPFPQVTVSYLQEHDEVKKPHQMSEGKAYSAAKDIDRGMTDADEAVAREGDE